MCNMALEIGVIGAGAVGLSTALHLQQEFPSARVTVVSKAFNDQVLSSIAAGIFRPGSGFHGPTPDITEQWLNYSYDYYDQLRKTVTPDVAGIIEVSGYAFSSQDKDVVENTFLKKKLPVYRSATKAELGLCPGEWKYGVYYTTQVIGCTRFLPWAMSQFKLSGGRISVETVTDLAKQASQFDVTVNCTGYEAKKLCTDDKIVPIRGQIYQVSAPWIRMFYYFDTDTYIIPGIDHVTVGGCRQYGSIGETVDPYDSSAIWNRGSKFLPAIRDATIIRQCAGLRPHRSPVRVEKEVLQWNGKNVKIVHNYGHGGYGITSAPGTSRHAVQLVKEFASGYDGENLTQSKL